MIGNKSDIFRLIKVSTEKRMESTMGIDAVSHPFKLDSFLKSIKSLGVDNLSFQKCIINFKNLFDTLENYNRVNDQECV